LFRGTFCSFNILFGLGTIPFRHGAHTHGQGGERQAGGQDHSQVVPNRNSIPDDVASHLHRREGKEGALDLAHADADHREAGSDDFWVAAEDSVQQFSERHFHDLGKLAVPTDQPVVKW
jgi:hypothetical protein